MTSSKKSRARALRMTTPVIYKTNVQKDCYTGEKRLEWTSQVLISADGALDANGNHSPNEPRRTVGTITGRAICRNDIRRTFWDSMQEPSQKTGSLAYALFDRYGCLREEFLVRGTGIWGREINDKCIQLLQSMSVNAGFAFAQPTKIIFSGIEFSDADKIALFREEGFRRVGATTWFAKAYDPAHPANSAASLASDVAFVLPVTNLSAVENIKARLEFARTRTKIDGKIVDVSSAFRGHSDADVKALRAAQAAENPGSTNAPTVLQTKYGCACGKCLGGFISPRMKFVMVKQLSKIYHGLYGSIAGDGHRIYLAKNKNLVAEIMGGYAWTFAPEPIKSAIFDSKDAGLGYCYTLRYVKEILQRDMVPDVTTVTLGFPRTDIKTTFPMWKRISQRKPNVKQSYLTSVLDSYGYSLDPSTIIQSPIDADKAAKEQDSWSEGQWERVKPLFQTLLNGLPNSTPGPIVIHNSIRERSLLWMYSKMNQNYYMACQNGGRCWRDIRAILDSDHAVGHVSQRPKRQFRDSMTKTIELLDIAKEWLEGFLEGAQDQKAFRTLKRKVEIIQSYEKARFAQVLLNIQDHQSEVKMDLMVLQLEENRYAIQQAVSIGRLTKLAFLFVLLTTVCSAFGMNLREFDQHPTIWWFIGTSVLCTLAATVWSTTFIKRITQRTKEGLTPRTVVKE
ncbi:hypothetical protein EJ08DRAFT_711179 [Tothia fuscella]|uniref:Transmembrane protein n=1 Tax=Tothia fuscella TaxID=1048955 RepID=A0A9P4P2X2_9PEZI|nr:hypothetical protein EJ08DRAFT_711179 [Tothia fuscella]